MDNYSVRRATHNDLAFLADVVINAEKSNSNTFSYTTLFNVSEDRFKELLIAMFEEDVDGCEFSKSSFLVIEFGGQPVAGFSGWIEGHNGSIASKLLKSNLLGFTLGNVFLGRLKATSEIVRDMLIEREIETLQLEYLYILEKHRGQKLADTLIQEHIFNALQIAPELKKVQVQCFGNNSHAINVYERLGFTVVKRVKSAHDDILAYLPFSEKVLMEKTLN